MKSIFAIIIFGLAALASIGVAKAGDMDTLQYPARTYALGIGYTNDYVLSAGVNESVSVPAGAKYAVLSFDDDIWVKVGGAAAIPIADVTGGAGSVFNPAAVNVENQSVMGIICVRAATGSVTFSDK